MRRLGLISLAAVMVGALIGCGRKADPLPPIIEVPETTTDLTVVQMEEEAVLTWSYPQMTRAGRPLVDLARVEVYRLEVPPGQEQPASGPAGEELRRRLMLGRGKLVARLEGESLREATRGNKLVFADPLPQVKPGTTPSSFWYAVRSRRRDGTASALSNIVTLQPRPVPAAVTGLAGTPQADGINLSWQEVPHASYLLERRDVAGGPWEAVSPEGLAATSFTDTKAAQQHTWRYRIRAIVDGVRSAVSPEVEVPYPDIYPPSAVSSLICLPEVSLVRLRWDALLEPGVRYKVFRHTVGREGWEHLEESYADTEFTDPAPPRGEVQYAVKAVDTAGNQSEASVCTVRVGQ